MAKYFIDHIYWALESGYLNLSGGTPDPMDGSDVHQAFNPCHGDITIPRPKYETQLEYHSKSLDPDPNLSFTKDLVPGTGIFPGEAGMTYRDPFLLACVFDHKTVTGTWAGGAATYGKITGDFSAVDDRSSIMIQCGITDGTTPINRCYNGVVITAYILGYKKNEVLKESIEISVGYFTVNTQAFVPNASFDDGQWADWAKSTVYHATDMVVYWDEAHTTELAGLAIEECQFKISTPRAVEADSSSLMHQHEWGKKRTFEATITGILTGNTEYLEVEKLFASKTKKDLRMQWDSTSSETKWLQIDDAWIEDLGAETIPHLENARRVTLMFKGESAQFEGNYENLADPTTRIDVSP